MLSSPGCSCTGHAVKKERMRQKLILLLVSSQGMDRTTLVSCNHPPRHQPVQHDSMERISAKKTNENEKQYI